MKEINMYIRGITYNTDIGIVGQYIVIMEYKGVSKEIHKTYSEIYVTSSRMLIKGLIAGLNSLKESCKINLYTHAYVGLGKLKSGKGNKIDGVRKSVNKDLLLILKEVINKGGHVITETVGEYKQMELARKLRDIQVVTV